MAEVLEFIHPDREVERLFHPDGGGNCLVDKLIKRGNTDLFKHLVDFVAEWSVVPSGKVIIDHRMGFLRISERFAKVPKLCEIINKYRLQLQGRLAGKK